MSMMNNTIRLEYFSMYGIIAEFSTFYYNIDINNKRNCEIYNLSEKY